MSFLQDECRFGFYTRDKADGSRPFRCGDDDLDEEREFRGVKPDRPLNSRLMYFDLIELVR